MSDATTNPTPEGKPPAGADETFGWTSDTSNGGSSSGNAGSAREWLAQLQAMIENIT